MNPKSSRALPSEVTGEVFGFRVPPRGYYLHQGHAWAVPEDTGLVRLGMDDFSQKVLGPADEIRTPAVGMFYYQDHICMALVRQEKKASFLAPVSGAVAQLNPKVRENPRLIHDDPYGEGWLLKVRPTNLQNELARLFYGEVNADWIFHQSHRLMDLMEGEVGVTVPDGGAFIDDVFGNYPQLGWRCLVKEFLLTGLAKEWKKRT